MSSEDSSSPAYVLFFKPSGLSDIHSLLEGLTAETLANLLIGDSVAFYLPNRNMAHGVQEMIMGGFKFVDIILCERPAFTSKKEDVENNGLICTEAERCRDIIAT